MRSIHLHLTIKNHRDSVQCTFVNQKSTITFNNKKIQRVSFNDSTWLHDSTLTQIHGYLTFGAFFQRESDHINWKFFLFSFFWYETCVANRRCWSIDEGWSQLKRRTRRVVVCIVPHRIMNWLLDWLTHFNTCSTRLQQLECREEEEWRRMTNSFFQIYHYESSQYLKYTMEK